MPIRYKMRIEKIKQETSDSKSFIVVPVDFDEGLFNYLPGQFFTLEAEITRPEVLTYDHSKKMIIGSGEEINVVDKKAFSIVSSPTEDDYIELLIKSERGAFVPYLLEQAKVGDVCTLVGPQGNFMHKLIHNQENLVACWSAGSGISSTISLMKFILDKGLNVKVVVFDSNRAIEDIIYHERIKELTKQSENFSIVFTLTRNSNTIPKSSHQHIKSTSGRFWMNGENTLEKYTGSNWQEYFNTICGSSSFINGKTRDEQGKLTKLGKGIEDHLLEVGIPQDKLDKDQFYLQ